MRKIVAGLFISLDGVVEAPETWHFAYFNDEMGEIVGGQMAEADTMLLGRRTYEEFASYWPNATDGPIATQMNGTPKLVASRTLREVTWQNARLLGDDVAAELTALKAGPGKDIGITGSPTLVRSLIAAGVLDELRLLIHPIVVGSGKRLFEGDELARTGLKLLDTKTLSTGVIYARYAPSGR